jgi:hypothetical protein
MSRWQIESAQSAENKKKCKHVVMVVHFSAAGETHLRYGHLPSFTRLARGAVKARDPLRVGMAECTWSGTARLRCSRSRESESVRLSPRWSASVRLPEQRYTKAKTAKIVRQKLQQRADSSGRSTTGERGRRGCCSTCMACVNAETNASPWVR